MKLCKMVVGIKVDKRLFRVTSWSGEIIDAVMEQVGGRVLREEYFTRVHRSGDGSLVRLTDSEDEDVNSLSVDTESIIFTKDHYDKGTSIDFEEVFKEFQVLWQACNGVLKIKDIRRIGLVGEYRLIPRNNPSAWLLKNLTKIQPEGAPAKFQIQFQQQSSTGASGLPDAKKSDFWNTIESYYDSILDTENDEEGQITAMIDVQRYFMPLLNSGIPDEVRRLKKRYDDVLSRIKARDWIKQLDSEAQAENV